MMKFVCGLFFIFIFKLFVLENVFAEEFTEEDRKYLVDLPELTGENLRWLVPADAWRVKESHFKKGKYFKMSSIDNLNVYTSPSIEGEPAYKLANIPLKNGDDLCEYEYERKDIDLGNVLMCADSSCKHLTLSGDTPDNARRRGSNYEGNKFSDAEFLLNRDKYKKCSAQIDYVTTYYVDDHKKDSIYDFVTTAYRGEMKLNRYLRTVRVDKDKNYAEILINEKKHYVDIRGCKEKGAFCKEVDIRFSDYEKDWIRLKKHQEKKDLYGMNYLLKNLKPCVDKKDKKCIKKFFPDPVKHSYLPDSFIGYEIPNVEINDEVLKELEACLDYKNLLPHLYASKGVNKACIFNFRDRVEPIDASEVILLNLTYPEAVRISWGTEIYMVPEKK